LQVVSRRFKSLPHKIKAEMANLDARPIVATELEPLFGGLTDFGRIYLAVSGGADSTALMHLVAAWLEAGWPKNGGGLRPDVCVLTVDHGLRPEAAAEAEGVVAAADSLGLRAEILCWQGAKPKTGLQEAARAARYEVMLGHIRQAVGDPAEAVLVTGHHRDDTAETLLMRLARGAGVDGLASMQAHGYREELAILRPLLDTPKSRLQATLNVAGASWIEDPSNQNLMFERVQLRAAEAARAELGLDDAALALTARRMARARRALDTMTADWLAPSLREPLLARSGIYVWRGLAGSIPDEIAIRALMRLLPAIGGIDLPPRLLRTERLWDDMQHGDFAGATLCNCVVRPGKEADMIIYREPERGSLPEIDTEPGRALVWDNRFEVKTNESVRVRPLTLQDLAKFEFDARANRMSYPVDALRATPVFADGDGLLAIPALNMHRDGPKALAAEQLTCRFIVERINDQFAAKAP
jgi:tRNA(Ile)-lysidine synthase